MYTFEEIVGNELLKKSLQNAIARKKTAHAYIFEGGPGMGKKMFARTMAKTMQCLEGGITPCQKCLSCKTFDSLNHPDIVYVTPTSGKSVGVDDIRTQVNKNIETKTYRYAYKVFIIDNAHTMTPAAQNALLKTIEEPVGYGVFFLACENLMNILPTVLSRAVVLKLKPLPDAVVADYLINKGIPPASAAVFASYARGSIGMALAKQGDGQFQAVREAAINAALTCAKGGSQTPACQAFAAAAALEPFKESIHDILDILYIWYRDVLVYKATRDTSRLIEKENANKITETAAALSVKSLLAKLDAIWQAGARLKANAHFGMTLDVLIMELMQ